MRVLKHSVQSYVIRNVVCSRSDRNSKCRGESKRPTKLGPYPFTDTERQGATFLEDYISRR